MEAISPMPESKVRIACLQMEPHVGEKERNLERSLAMLADAASRGAQLAILPELCNSGYVFATRQPWSSRRPAARGQRDSLDDPPRPEQHCRRRAFHQADQVHAEVHAVGEVHVGVPRRAEHHRVPRGLPPVGVRGGIRLPGVRLDLGELDRDQAGRRLVPKHAAEQVRRDLDRVPGEEVPRDRHSRYRASSAAQVACVSTIARSAVICSATRSGAVPP